MSNLFNRFWIRPLLFLLLLMQSMKGTFWSTSSINSSTVPRIHLNCSQAHCVAASVGPVVFSHCCRISLPFPEFLSFIRNNSNNSNIIQVSYSFSFLLNTFWFISVLIFFFSFFCLTYSSSSVFKMENDIWISISWDLRLRALPPLLRCVPQPITTNNFVISH